jgi:hypothetical protein
LLAYFVANFLTQKERQGTPGNKIKIRNY